MNIQIITLCSLVASLLIVVFLCIACLCRTKRFFQNTSRHSYSRPGVVRYDNTDFPVVSFDPHYHHGVHSLPRRVPVSANRVPATSATAFRYALPVDHFTDTSFGTSDCRGNHRHPQTPFGYRTWNHPPSHLAEPCCMCRSMNHHAPQRHGEPLFPYRTMNPLPTDTTELPSYTFRTPRNPQIPPPSPRQVPHFAPRTTTQEQTNQHLYEDPYTVSLAPLPSWPPNPASVSAPIPPTSHLTTHDSLNSLYSSLTTQSVSSDVRELSGDQEGGDM